MVPMLDRRILEFARIPSLMWDDLDECVVGIATAEDDREQAYLCLCLCAVKYDLPLVLVTDIWAGALAAASDLAYAQMGGYARPS